MPLYEYRCKKCGHRFEKIQSFSAPDEKECPVCGSEVERLISAPAIQFKGSGFYSTDYPSKPSSAGKSPEGGSKEGGSDSSQGNKESSSSGESASKPSSGSESASPAPAAGSTPAPSSGVSSKT